MKALLPFFAAFVFALSTVARAGEVKVKGKTEFKLKPEGSAFVLKGTKWNGARLIRTSSGSTLFSHDRKELAHCKRLSSGKRELVGDGLSYQVKFDDPKIKLFDRSGKNLFSVKLKKSKFNLYNSGRKRIAHGKPKPDGSYKLVNQNGARELKIKGLKSMKDAALLSFPIPVPLRIALWGCGS